MTVPPKLWRSERSLRGVQSQVQAAITRSMDGASAVLDLSTAHAVIEIIEQARHTEANHEQPPER